MQIRLFWSVTVICDCVHANKTFLICDCVLKYCYGTKDLLREYIIGMVEDAAKLPLYFIFWRHPWAYVLNILIAGFLLGGVGGDIRHPPPILSVATIRIQNMHIKSFPLINIKSCLNWMFCSTINYLQLRTPRRRGRIPLLHSPLGVEHSCNITYLSKYCLLFFQWTHVAMYLCILWTIHCINYYTIHVVNFNIQKFPGVHAFTNVHVQSTTKVSPLPPPIFLFLQ